MFGWNLRYAVRVLLKTPGFALMALLTIAISTGLTTALFSVLHGVLFRPLPFKDPEKLAILWETTAEHRDISVSYQDYQNWRERNTTFANLTAIRLDYFNLSAHGQAERVPGRMVSANFFSTLGVHPVVGRDFRADEDRLNGKPAVILSYKLWKRLFQNDPKILGQTLKANDKAFTIVGIMPESFHIFTEVDFFVPIGLFAEDWIKRDNHPGIYVIGRLKSGSTLQAGTLDIEQIALQLQKQYPDTNTGEGIRLQPLAQNITGDAKPALWLLFGAVIFVLLIACANIANMMIARGMGRQKEIAIRMALGASRKDLILQLLMESMLLAFAGGLIGLFLAQNAREVLLWLRPENIPRLEEITIDKAVLGFSFGISALSGVLFGLLPAIQSSAFSLNQSIKESGQLPVFQGHYRLRNILVVSQVGLSLLLLVGAGLMTKSILILMKSKTGFETERLLTIQLSLSQQKYQEQKVISYLKEVENQVLQVPGVQSFAYTNGLPMAGANEAIFWIENKPKPRPGYEFPVVQYLVSPGYFQTLKIPLLQGRYFLSSDDTNQPDRVIIDDILAKKYFPDENPIGQSLRLSNDFPPFEIVGVVGHVHQYSLDATPPIDAELYISISQIPDHFLSEVAQDLHLLIRTSDDPSTVVDSVRAALKRVDPEQATEIPMPMKQLIGDSFAARRFSMVLLSVFAVVALFLAAAGIYAVLSYMVTQRSKEIGIRMAVGAKKLDVLKLILAGGFRLIFAGLLIGILTSIALSRLIATQVYAVSPTDPSTILTISALLAVVGLAATYFPAARATKIDPVSILKQQ